MVRGPSAYFLFAESVRADVQQHLQAENPGCKVSVATLGKAIGERWRCLSDEEKQKFKTQAAERATTDEAETGESEVLEGELGAQHLQPASLPLSFLKKIVTMDQDVGRVGAEGLRSLAHATESFLGLLAGAALRHAAADKRKNFRFQDVLAVAKADRRMVIMGLAEVLQTDPVFQEARTGRVETSKTRHRGAAAAADIEETGGIQPLTVYFAPGVAGT